MTTAAELPRLTALSHGAGCACKLPLATLEQLMASVGQGLGGAGGDLLVGAEEGDDAAVLRLDARQALVLTTDFFTPIVDDARDWGRIAAANALSDVYAMGGRPILALNLTAWPAADLPVELLAEVLRGGAEVAAEAGCPVVGGHSIDDPEPKYGLAVVGLADPARLLTIARARPGDRLVLTKPLGTGVVATAVKRGDPDPAAVAAAVASMTTLNRDAAEAAVAAGVEAATDVTGFGLLGHLHRMLRASGVAGEVYAARVPFLPGAAELAAAGFVSGGTRNNQAYLGDHVELEPGLPPVVATLLHDAQTSGGLLLSVPAGALGDLVADLRRRRIEPAVVGRVVEGTPGRLAVRRLPRG
ncbi:MAG TPA: selenide, water dikinase SelD [Actinomycetota bacterium]|jgi:selenide,water dikinase|nr:selenide, water dikinase SelD [Actinomycetota bacterium]